MENTEGEEVIRALVLVLFLQGCAIPLPLQIVSWATQGVSYVATEKSIGDNVVSQLLDMDCDTFRMVTEWVDYCTDIIPEEDDDIWIVMSK